MTDNSLADYHRPAFHICRSCGKPRVLRVGDYCRECATDPYAVVAMDKYIIVEPNTIDDTAAKTGIAQPYLNAKYYHCDSMNCHYVVFHLNDDEWHEIVVDRYFHLPRVMETVFDRMK